MTVDALLLLLGGLATGALALWSWLDTPPRRRAADPAAAASRRRHPSSLGSPPVVATVRAAEFTRQEDRP